MSELILHHYPASPFSEKVRLLLGFKRLAWRSVRIPAVMPKPDVIALTGGYRKTPLLQIGNHVYCDTALIARVLERRAPKPALYADPEAELVASWADSVLFEVVVTLGRRPSKFDTVFTLLEPHELEQFRNDRVAMWQGARRNMPRYATARSLFPVFAARVQAFVEGREQPSIAGFSIYHCLWFLRMFCPELLEPYPGIARFMERMGAIGHGTSEPMSSADAIAVCAAALPQPIELDDATPDPNGLSIGQRVKVNADDYGCDPVSGELVASAKNEIALLRRDERAGDVIVHFPRVGYEIAADAGS
jgi:glutathione S-transferase